MASSFWYYFWNEADWPQVEGDRFELELDGEGAGWTDVTDDVLLDFGFTYGINGAGPTALGASIGTMRFQFDNSEDNSAGLRGYYSPQHADCRPGFKLGIGFRYFYRMPGSNDEYRKFRGRLVSIDPVAGKWGPRRTSCVAADWLYEASISQPKLPVQINKTADEILGELVDAMDRQPSNRSFAPGVSVFPYALDNSRSESQSVLTELQRLCQSEFAHGYVRGGLNAWETLVIENRTFRLTPMPVAYFYGRMQDIGGGEATADAYNRAAVKTHPRRVGGDTTTVLFSKPAQSAPAIAAGSSITFQARYGDASTPNARIGGTDFQPLTPGTDYIANSAADGSGSVVTSDLAVTISTHANQADVIVANNGAATAYLTTFQIRGRSLRDYDAIDTIEQDDASVAEIGKHEVTLDMVYQSDPSVAKPIAEFLVATLLTPGVSEGALTFIPRDEDEFLEAFAIEPGDPIGVTEEQTAIGGTYYVQQVEMRSEEAGAKRTFRWILKRALVADYWQVGIAGLSELGVTTVAAPL